VARGSGGKEIKKVFLIKNKIKNALWAFLFLFGYVKIRPWI
jgi:hypothetical protein